MILDPRVTIVSIYFNREEAVEESINSLLEQEYKNIRIVLVDDNSRDDTLERMLELRNRDNRIEIIANKTNKGFTQSLIDSLRNCPDEYIAIHGSGDISHKDRIAKQVRFLQSNLKVGAVGCFIEKKDLVLDKINLVKPKENTDVLNSICLMHGEVMFRNDIYKQVGGYRNFFVSSQDRDLWLRMSLISELSFIPEILYTAYNRRDGVTGNPYRRLTQLFYAEISKQMYKMRLKTGSDFIDRYGTSAWAFRLRSAKLAKQIATHSLWTYRQGLKDDAKNILKISLQEKRILLNSSLWLLYVFLSPFEKSHIYLSNILNFRRNMIKRQHG